MIEKINQLDITKVAIVVATPRTIEPTLFFLRIQAKPATLAPAIVEIAIFMGRATEFSSYLLILYWVLSCY
jgi:hypothetical protein